MNRKFTALVTAVAASGVLALGAAGTASASAGPQMYYRGTPAIHNATTVCGAACDDVSGELLGPNLILNATNLGRVHGTNQGRKVNLRAGGNSKTNEDWDIDVVGTLAALCGTEISSTSFACLNLPSSAPVFEANFTPNSVATVWCAGALAPIAGYKIRLEHCGTAKTLFVEDLANGDFGDSSGLNYVPLVYAPDHSDTHPLVVTVREFGNRPAHQVYLSRLNLTGADEAVSSQLVIHPVPVGPFS